MSLFMILFVFFLRLLLKIGTISNTLLILLVLLYTNYHDSCKKSFYFSLEKGIDKLWQSFWKLQCNSI